MERGRLHGTDKVFLYCPSGHSIYPKGILIKTLYKNHAFSITPDQVICIDPCSTRSVPDSVYDSARRFFERHGVPFFQIEISIQRAKEQDEEIRKKLAIDMVHLTPGQWEILSKKKKCVKCCEQEAISQNKEEDLN